MRLLELSLLAYGSFSNLRLDFSRPAQAMHLVYGANEAGKSTTLRAILALLYGIEHQSSDAHLHGGPNLRIGARLSDEQGHELWVTRRKGKKDTLLDAEGKPIEEAVLSRMLGELSEPVFRSMFGLDHERLRQGGEQLRRGQGDLGESLFQAGVGGPDIGRVVANLSKEADALFTPRGKLPVINEAIRAYDEAKKRLREHTSHADSYRAEEQELETARQRSAALHAQRQALMAEQQRLLRLQRVLPGLAKRAVLLAARQELGEVVLLPDDAAEQRQAAQQALAASEAPAQQLRRALDALAARRAALQISESLGALDPETVRRVRDRLGSHKKAAFDLPQRRSELRLLEAEARAALRRLGDPAPLEAVETLRVDSATQARIAKLVSVHSGLREQRATAKRELGRALGKLAAGRAELGIVQRPLALANEQDAVPQLPPEASIASFRKRFERIESERARHIEQALELDQREARMQRAIDTMQHEGAPLTEHDLMNARARRDAAWGKLREQLAGGAVAEALGSAPSYEALLQHSDEVADRLRREAGRVSQLAGLLAERAAIARERERLREQRAAVARGAEVAADEWQRVWEPIGVTPRPPAEMQSLCAKVAALLDEGRRGRLEAEQDLARAEQVLQRWQSEWGELMQRLALRTEASIEEAQAVLQGLQALFDTVDEMNRLRLRIEAMERDAAEFSSDLAVLLARHLPELSGLAVEQGAEELLARYESARRALDERARIEEQLDIGQKDLEVLHERAARANHALDTLQRAASADSPEALEHAERRSARARELARSLGEVEQELLSLGEGVPIEQLIAATATQGPDGIRVRLHDIEGELETVNLEHTSAVRATGSLETTLLGYLGNDQAAQAAAEAEQHLSRVRSHVHSYLRKRLAADLLQREIRRYRDANQGPIIQRASELFARLTLGRYPKLEVGYDEKDEPVLLCLPGDGRSVTAPSLSDGTRDQLYLALRLATLERFAQHNPPMPLVLDDVLIHFDDDRARAALTVLGELAGSMQVLFFTHHARLLDLAREAVPSQRLVEHRLGPLAALP